MLKENSLVTVFNSKSTIRRLFLAFFFFAEMAERGPGKNTATRAKLEIFSPLPSLAFILNNQ